MNNFKEKYLTLILNGLSFLCFIATMCVVFYAVNFKNMSISSFFFLKSKKDVQYFLKLNEEEIKNKVFDGTKVLLTVDNTVTKGDYKLFLNRCTPKTPTVIILEQNVLLFSPQKNIEVYSKEDYKTFVVQKFKEKLGSFNFWNSDKLVLFDSISKRFESFIESSHDFNKYIPNIIFIRSDSNGKFLYLSMDSCYKIQIDFEREILDIFKL